MKTWIDLSATVLDFSAIAGEITDKIQLLNKEKTGLITMPHACTIIAGWELLTDERWAESIRRTLEIEEPLSPVFTVPTAWRMPAVMKALGAFKSNSDASKNGWNKDIEEGISTHVCRMHHARWAFTTFRVPKRICEMGSWDLCEATDEGSIP